MTLRKRMEEREEKEHAIDTAHGTKKSVSWKRSSDDRFAFFPCFPPNTETGNGPRCKPSGIEEEKETCGKIRMGKLELTGRSRGPIEIDSSRLQIQEGRMN